MNTCSYDTCTYDTCTYNTCYSYKDPKYAEGFSTVADGDGCKVVPIPKVIHECSTADPNEVHITYDI